LNRWTELESVEGTPSAVIVLIHGTFARDAEWVKSGSQLHKDIKKYIAKSPLVCSFTWSGRNCILHRELASAALREELAKSLERYPATPHILIGHSHGGNVAIQSVAGLPSPESIKIVCLSTPFIYAIPRSYSDRPHEKKPTAVDHGTLLMFVLVSIALLMGLRSDWALRIVTIGVGLPTFFLMRSMIKRYRDWSLKLSGPRVPRIELPSGSLLFLRFLADEATFALITFQSIQYALVRIAKAQAQLIEKTGDILRYLAGKWSGFFSLFLMVAGGTLGILLLYLASLISGLVGARHPVDADWLAPHNPHFVVVIIPVMLAPAIIFFLMLLTLFLMVLNIVLYVLMPLVGVKVFGWRLAASSVFNEITVESAPLGTWNLLTLFPLPGDVWLRHSMGYEDPKARQQVTTFIIESLKA
jgi:hypothetical protein